MPDTLNQKSAMDVLGDVLETLHFRGTIFFRSDLAAPWGIQLQPVAAPRFHIAMSGTCVIGGVGHNAVHVDAMEIVLLPQGNSHWIADQPGRALVAAEQAGEACELGDPLFQDGAITNRLMCGIVNYDKDFPHPLLESLPDVLHFPKLHDKDPIWATVTLIDAEMHRTREQSRTIVDRLTEVLFLQLLAAHIERDDQQAGFFAALRDRRLRHALTLLHENPATNWTLELLGDKVGMSRATLVRHFQDAVGVAPMAYLADWRIMKAHNLVKHSSMPFEKIAETVGFASARTLSRAFVRHYSITPKELRRKNGG